MIYTLNADRIKSIRNELNLSAKDFSKIAGCSEYTIILLEQGRISISYTSQSRIFAHLFDNGMLDLIHKYF